MNYSIFAPHQNEQIIQSDEEQNFKKAFIMLTTGGINISTG